MLENLTSDSETWTMLRIKINTCIEEINNLLVIPELIIAETGSPIKNRNNTRWGI